MTNEKWLNWAIELQALAQAGLFYGRDVYDIERFQRIRDIAAEMLADRTELPPLSEDTTTAEQIELCFAAHASATWEPAFD